jgi:hypothetical protein
VKVEGRSSGAVRTDATLSSRRGAMAGTWLMLYDDVNC